MTDILYLPPFNLTSVGGLTVSKQSTIRTQIGFLTHHISGKAFPVSDLLTTRLVETLANQITLNETLADALVSCRTIVFNFRDKSYSAEQGGFHPVEICLVKHSSGDWHYQYVTDFAYMGNYYPELEKALDFDFESHGAYSCGIPERTEQGAHELYQLWERNFLAYVEMDVYDDIRVQV
ncbi:DUF2787 domain-containing protein [Vibrio parahaemolyticus]|nr:DUF2787 domain-containing protein [Vibrio parahaemolyticus]EHK0753032.1 DUF2787 domain-containing protein [Vibrio parahaemolyticus]EHR5320089.1 DUF2787 domain-containing protein [Vibrio parahaemolyticus]EJB8454246.1 DUF2787 domain-containing protein [Vibrio parahaemolyticus]MBD6982850.1 DUF2787 domain-containing protein [Vibrio parahaemolyticus]